MIGIRGELSKMKRDATEQETEDTIKRYEQVYPDTRQLHEEAVKEGYKAEVCLLNKCNTIYLAHHHLTRCTVKNCPMTDGQGSLLDRMFKELED